MSRKSDFEPALMDQLVCSELENFTDKALEDFARRLAEDMTVRITQLVLVVRKLVEREIDLDPLCKEFPVIRRAMLVADKKLSDKAFEAHYENKPLLNCLKSLPLKEQDRLVNVGSVKVYTIDSDGRRTVDYRSIKLEEMVQSELDMVFDIANARVRNVEEQQKWARQRSVKILVKERQSKITFYEATQTISCHRATIEELRDFLNKYDRKR